MYLMMQGFEWHVPADQRHWQRLRKAILDLKDIGVDNIWIPPGCKAMSPSGIGYDIYDLYDLGEFDQKGTRKAPEPHDGAQRKTTRAWYGLQRTWTLGGRTDAVACSSKTQLSWWKGLLLTITFTIRHSLEIMKRYIQASYIDSMELTIP